jgi:hypothetical protein
METLALVPSEEEAAASPIQEGRFQMRTVTLTFEVGWSDRKINQVKGDILRDMLQWGAKNPQWSITGDAPPVVKLLKLECKRCWASGKPKRGEKRQRLQWENATFTACPKCNRRDSVAKVESKLLEGGEEVAA